MDANEILRLPTPHAPRSRPAPPRHGEAGRLAGRRLGVGPLAGNRRPCLLPVRYWTRPGGLGRAGPGNLSSLNGVLHYRHYLFQPPAARVAMKFSNPIPKGHCW